MKYPIAQLTTSGTELVNLAYKMRNLSGELDSVNATISRCYGQGGVGSRTSLAAGSVSGQAGRVQHLGEVAAEAAKFYVEAENQLAGIVYKVSGDTYEPRTVPDIVITPEPTVWDGAKKAFDTGEKIWKTVKAVGSIGLAVAGCAATWAATLGSAGTATPLALLSTTYTANKVYSNFSDIYNLWAGDESKVGNVNVMKDLLAEGGGDLSEMLCGNREIGELVGKAAYSVGEVYVDINNAKNLFKFTNGLIGKNSDTYNHLVDTGDQISNAVHSKLNLNLKSRIIQDDLSLKTVVEAVKEIPKAVSGVWKLGNVPIQELPMWYSLYGKEIKNIKSVSSSIKLLKDVADVTADVTNVVVEGVTDIIRN